MIQTICVCGAGTMGLGIAQAAAQHGFSTILYDIDSSKIEAAKARLEKNTEILEQKNKLSSIERKDLLKRISYTSSANQCQADIIIEAIVEDLELKTGLFNQLAAFNSPKTIFASNTSSLPIMALADKIIHPERVAGMHFFNPATTMKLVEVVITPATNDRTKQLVIDLALRMGKIAVLCQDAPGFIVNRVARPFYLESLWIHDQYSANVELIDELMESSGFRMGPFRLMDLIGNDINYAVSKSLYESLERPARLMPSPVQEKKVSKGELGRKTGLGYYRYAE